MATKKAKAATQPKPRKKSNKTITAPQTPKAGQPAASKPNPVRMPLMTPKAVVQSMRTGKTVAEILGNQSKPAKSSKKVTK